MHTWAQLTFVNPTSRLVQRHLHTCRPPKTRYSNSLCSLSTARMILDRCLRLPRLQPELAGRDLHPNSQASLHTLGINRASMRQKKRKKEKTPGFRIPPRVYIYIRKKLPSLSIKQTCGRGEPIGPSLRLAWRLMATPGW